MEIICARCGKTVQGDGIAFCPYCGRQLEQQAARQAEQDRPEVLEWIEKAQKQGTIRDREKMLHEARALYPDSRAIEWELLFIGKPLSKRRDGDFFIIKSYLLQMYRQPNDFTEQYREMMRQELWENSDLLRYLEKEEQPDETLAAYLRRVCLEYLEIFLEGDNRVMGSVFGFRREKAREKAVAVPVSRMIANINADSRLTQERRKMLSRAIYMTFSERYGGKTEYLDELMK